MFQNYFLPVFMGIIEFFIITEFSAIVISLISLSMSPSIYLSYSGD